MKRTESKKISLDSLRQIFSFTSKNDDEQQSLLTNRGEEAAPADTCYMTYIILYVHGMGHLLPWNFFITAHEYYSDKFTCPKDAHNCKSFNSSFENFFSVASMVPLLLMTLGNIWLQAKIHYKWRMLASLLMTLLLFALTTVFVGVNTDTWVDGFFAVTLITVVLISLSSAVFQSSTFGLSGILPAKYTSIVMTGQAFAGILAAIASILSIAAGHGDKGSAFGYFATAVFVILLCTTSFFVLMKLEFVRYHLRQTSVNAQESKKRQAENASVQASVDVKVVNTSLPFWKIFQKIWIYALSVFLVFTVTLSVFPAIISSIKSSASNPKASGWTDEYFTPIVCFFLFNVSDFVGRYITHWVTFGKNRYVLLLLSVARIVFIPLFMFCNARPNGHHAIPLLFHSDVYPILFTFVFGVTNGYFSTLCMVFAPQEVLPDHRETAGTTMAFFLSAGLLMGGLLSFVWSKIITL